MLGGLPDLYTTDEASLIINNSLFFAIACMKEILQHTIIYRILLINVPTQNHRPSFKKQTTTKSNNSNRGTPYY